MSLSEPEASAAATMLMYRLLKMLRMLGQRLGEAVAFFDPESQVANHDLELRGCRTAAAMPSRASCRLMPARTMTANWVVK